MTKKPIGREGVERGVYGLETTSSPPLIACPIISPNPPSVHYLTKSSSPQTLQIISSIWPLELCQFTKQHCAPYFAKDKRVFTPFELFDSNV